MRTALTVFFAVHALSAALAVGLPFVMAWSARRRPALARGMATVALVNLSISVVMGVAALLFISRAWTKPFTAAVVDLFPTVLAVVPLLSISYAALYAFQIKGWAPGPAIAGVALLAVGAVFASVAAWSNNPGIEVRLAHFVPACVAAAGAAILVRFAGAGDDARWGARLAFGGTILQAGTGVWYVFSIPELPHGLLLWAPVGGAAGLAILLGALAFGARITRFSSIAAAAGMFFVVLSMASLREGIRSSQAAQPGPTSGGRRMAARLDGFPGMENFARISPGLYRSAQPTSLAWPVLKAMGIRTVIGLRSHHADREEAAKVGIQFVDMGLTAGAAGSSAPPEDQIRKFFEIVLDPAKQPVLFHCAQGKDRTGTMAALYRIEVDGWPAVEAVQEMEAFGYHAIYRELIEFVRGYAPRGYGRKK